MLEKSSKNPFSKLCFLCHISLKLPPCHGTVIKKCFEISVSTGFVLSPTNLIVVETLSTRPLIQLEHNYARIVEEKKCLWAFQDAPAPRLPNCEFFWNATDLRVNAKFVDAAAVCDTAARVARRILRSKIRGRLTHLLRDILTRLINEGSAVKHCLSRSI